MLTQPTTLLFIGDGPFLSSLQFSLALDGFAVTDGSTGFDPAEAACLVVDQAWDGSGFDFVHAFGAAGHDTPAVLLVTNPTQAQRSRAAAMDAIIVEKPLIGDELTQVLHLILQHRSVEARDDRIASH